MRKPNQFHYLFGKRRMQPVICFFCFSLLTPLFAIYSDSSDQFLLQTYLSHNKIVSITIHALNLQGTIVLAFVMVTLGLQVLLESGKQLARSRPPCQLVAHKKVTIGIYVASSVGLFFFHFMLRVFKFSILTIVSASKYIKS